MINFVQNILKYTLLAIVIIGSGAILVFPAVYLIAAAKTTGQIIYAVGAVTYTVLLIGIVGAVIEEVS